jgi:hypothetical protein
VLQKGVKSLAKDKKGPQINMTPKVSWSPLVSPKLGQKFFGTKMLATQKVTHKRLNSTAIDNGKQNPLLKYALGPEAAKTNDEDPTSTTTFKKNKMDEFDPLAAQKWKKERAKMELDVSKLNDDSADIDYRDVGMTKQSVKINNEDSSTPESNSNFLFPCSSQNSDHTYNTLILPDLSAGTKKKTKQEIYRI